MHLTYFRLFLLRLIRMPIRRIVNLFLYKFVSPLLKKVGTGRVIHWPPSVFLWVTSNCNLNCVFCHYKGTLNKSKEADLSKSDFREILKSSFLKNNIHIGFYGGEPFLNHNLFYFIRLAKEAGLLTSVTTNGTLIHQYKKEIETSFPDILSVSYYHQNYQILAQNIKDLPAGMIKKMKILLPSNSIEEVSYAVDLAVDNSFNMITFEIVLDDKIKSHYLWLFSDEFRKIKRMVENKMKGRRIKAFWPSYYKGKKFQCNFLWGAIMLAKGLQYCGCCIPPLTVYRDFNSAEDLWFGSDYRNKRLKMLKNCPIDSECYSCVARYDRSMNP